MSEKSYYRSQQIVPNKGMSYTYFEAEGETVIRILTSIPDVGEITLYPKPRVKTLWQPERMDTVEPQEFLDLWQQGEQNG